jgi:hypothetical protein
MRYLIIDPDFEDFIINKVSIKNNEITCTRISCGSCRFIIDCFIFIIKYLTPAKNFCNVKKKCNTILTQQTRLYTALIKKNTNIDIVIPCCSCYTLLTLGININLILPKSKKYILNL